MQPCLLNASLIVKNDCLLTTAECADLWKHGSARIEGTFSVNADETTFYYH
jgi:hypothetical protein